MALTRSMLRGMGLTDEQISAIIDAHIETVDGLKEERDAYKANSEKLREVQKELNELKNGEDWKAKYDDLQAEYDGFKQEQANKESKIAKENAYKQLLKDAGISDKRIDSVLKVTDLSNVKLDKEGRIKDAEALTDDIKSEWADFITNTQVNGAETQTPPASGGATQYASKAEVMAITDRAARRKAIAENPQLFTKGE